MRPLLDDVHVANQSIVDDEGSIHPDVIGCSRKRGWGQAGDLAIIDCRISLIDGQGSQQHTNGCRPRKSQTVSSARTPPAHHHHVCDVALHLPLVYR